MQETEKFQNQIYELGMPSGSPVKNLMGWHLW